MFVKIADFIKFKGFNGISREQALLRKSKAPRKSPEKWTLLSLAFCNAPSLHTVKLSFFAYSPLRCFLDTLSHCKQEASNCKKKLEL